MKQDSLLEDVADCYVECSAMLRHCLEIKGEHADPEHLLLLLDCADICQVLLNFNYTSSNSAKRVAELCAQICDQCAVSCENFKDDKDMQECAKMCRKCAESCRKIAGMEPMPS